jgi:hypothetical protein
MLRQLQPLCFLRLFAREGGLSKEGERRAGFLSEQCQPFSLQHIVKRGKGGEDGSGV